MSTVGAAPVRSSKTGFRLPCLTGAATTTAGSSSTVDVDGGGAAEPAEPDAPVDVVDLDTLQPSVLTLDAGSVVGPVHAYLSGGCRPDCHCLRCSCLRHVFGTKHPKSASSKPKSTSSLPKSASSVTSMVRKWLVMVTRISSTPPNSGVRAPRFSLLGADRGRLGGTDGASWLRRTVCTSSTAAVQSVRRLLYQSRRRLAAAVIVLVLLVPAVQAVPAAVDGLAPGYVQQSPLPLRRTETFTRSGSLS